MRLCHKQLITRLLVGAILVLKKETHLSELLTRNSITYHSYQIYTHRLLTRHNESHCFPFACDSVDVFDVGLIIAAAL
jgi:hypothetical protein